MNSRNRDEGQHDERATDKPASSGLSGGRRGYAGQGRDDRDIQGQQHMNRGREGSYPQAPQASNSFDSPERTDYDRDNYGGRQFAQQDQFGGASGSQSQLRSTPITSQGYGDQGHRMPNQDAQSPPLNFDADNPGMGHRGKGPKNYMRPDERVREDLNEKLTDADDIDASGITVEVSNGIATLNGTVGQRWMKHRAEDLAEGCSGVCDVNNQIRVKSPPDDMQSPVPGARTSAAQSSQSSSAATTAKTVDTTGSSQSTEASENQTTR